MKIMVIHNKSMAGKKFLALTQESSVTGNGNEIIGSFVFPKAESLNYDDGECFAQVEPTPVPFCASGLYALNSKGYPTEGKLYFGLNASMTVKITPAESWGV